MGRHRLLFALAAVVAGFAAQPASAEDPPPPAAQPPVERRAVGDGEFRSPYWSLVFRAPGIVEWVNALPGRIFLGRGGGCTIEIHVEESPTPRSAVRCRDAAREAWTARGRATRNLESGDAPTPWATFVEKGPSGLDRRHAFAFRARGLQSFVVHTASDLGADVAMPDVLALACGLELGEDRGGNVVAAALSWLRKMPPRAPATLLAAARLYVLKRADGGAENLPIAESLLERALREAKPGELTPDALHELHEMYGLLELNRRRTDAAIVWLTKALGLATATRSPDQSRARDEYNIACCHAVAGRPRDAIDALRRAFAAWFVVTADWLVADPDLVSLHEDPYWPRFVAWLRAEEAARKK